VVKDRLYTCGASSRPRRSAQTALHAVLHALVRLYAPVLVHSCEEVWDLVTLAAKEPSVHLAPWPDPPAEWRSNALAVKYEHLLAMRGAVNRALERLRDAGAIGRSLDARVSIHAADPAVARSLADADLASLFIVSEASVSAAPVGDEDGELAGVWVQAGPSPHRRCARCWARRPSVGSDPGHPQLCARCVSTLHDASMAGR
jgi:isoleucyl-tRNA synthetase